MKKGLLFTIAAAILYTSCGVYKNNTNRYTSYNCGETLTYFIRDIDHRFPVSEADIIVAMEYSANVWINAVDRNLVTYSDSGDIAIDLVYDERQQFEEKLEVYRYAMDSLGTIKDSMKIANEWVKDQISDSDYLVMREEYDKRSQRLVSLFETANEKDELTTEIIEEYNTEQQELSKLWVAIESSRKPYNIKVNDYNNAVSIYNSIVDEYNEAVLISNTMKRTYLARHDGELPPQGTFSWNSDEKKIEIFHFSDMHDLTLTLTHELGHAFGLPHSADTTSVMSASSFTPSETEVVLSNSDKMAIRNKCLGKPNS